jgi:glycosyltransferase involved in cell wall biosynthesis
MAMGNRRGIVNLQLGRDVLLFFEDRDRDTVFRGDRHLRRRLRKAMYRFRPGKQRISGFELSFILLCRALTEAGQIVHVNNFALARRNPDFPIGICGYTHIFKNWTLSNPAVLGPGLFDHPKQAPHLLSDPRYRIYIAFCEWMRDMFSTVYPKEQITVWFGGIDLREWPDTSTRVKDIDVIVYDKIRWNRDEYIPNLLEPVERAIQERGLRIEVVRYGQYTHESYRELLGRTRSMVFLCEHETQGMAYQEALASNVPVLAWDQGFWLDPNRPRWEPEPVPASSVPYFSGECGERFANAASFGPTLDTFLEQLDRYTPREWVSKNLSLAESANRYLHAYLRAGAVGEEALKDEPTARP